MSKYTVREANVNDVDFIIEAIIAAEKSGSGVLSYSTIFDLTEETVRGLFRQMLLEEMDGCEFSISSYLVAEMDGKAAGTIGAWVEKEDDPSSRIKGNLLGYFLPKSSLVHASQHSKVINELNIEHLKGSLALVIVYISPEHRGNRLFELLADAHVNRNAGIQEVSIQLMANNISAIKSYERYGLEKCFELRSENEKIKQFLPHNEKIVMKKQLK